MFALRNKKINFQLCSLIWRPDMRKSTFGVSDQVRLKPVCSATETSRVIACSNLDYYSFNMGKKLLIKLSGCSGWSAPLLFACKKIRFSSVSCPYKREHDKTVCIPSLDSDQLQHQSSQVSLCCGLNGWLSAHGLFIHIGRDEQKF